MAYEIEFELKGQIMVVNRGRVEAAFRHIKGHVPAVVVPWCESEPDLTQDLGPSMERGCGRGPVFVVEGWPCFRLLYVIHGSVLIRDRAPVSWALAKVTGITTGASEQSGSEIGSWRD